MAKHKGIDVTVFTLGGTALVGVLTDCTWQSTVQDEDGSSINEIDEDPEAVGRARQITGTAQVDDVAAFIALIEGANPVVTFTWNTGANTYAGSALLTQVSHATGRRRLQTEQFTLKVKGAPTITAPA